MVVLRVRWVHLPLRFPGSRACLHASQPVTCVCPCVHYLCACVYTSAADGIRRYFGAALVVRAQYWCCCSLPHRCVIANRCLHSTAVRCAVSCRSRQIWSSGPPGPPQSGPPLQGQLRRSAGWSGPVSTVRPASLPWRCSQGSQLRCAARSHCGLRSSRATTPWSPLASQLSLLQLHGQRSISVFLRR